MQNEICSYKAVSLKLASLGYFRRFSILRKIDREDRDILKRMLKDLKGISKQDAQILYSNLPKKQVKKNDYSSFTPKVASLLNNVKLNKLQLPKELHSIVLDSVRKLSEVSKND